MTAWNSPKLEITEPDLCAVATLASRKAFSLSDFADARAPWLSRASARSILKKMSRRGILAPAGRKTWVPTEKGWAAIKKASCPRPRPLR